jgi:hypothetical protein
MVVIFIQEMKTLIAIMVGMTEAKTMTIEMTDHWVDMLPEGIAMIEEAIAKAVAGQWADMPPEEMMMTETMMIEMLYR